MSTSATYHYYPILKAKPAEFKALSSFIPANIDIVPVFELQAPTRDETSKGLGPTHMASKALQGISTSWGKDCHVDVRPMSTNPAHRIAAWNVLSGPGHSWLSPVIHGDEDAAEAAAMAQLSAHTNRALFRADAISATPSSITQLASSTQARVVAAMSTPSRLILDVLLDWQDKSHRQHLPDMVSLASQVRASLSPDTRVIIAATPNTTQCTGAGAWQFDRRELWIHLRLMAAHMDVSYGDYALFAPQPPGFSNQPKYGHLRYSLDNDQAVVIRTVPAATGAQADSFRDACVQLYARYRAHTKPSTFCKADADLTDAAKGTQAFGATQKWRTLAMEHHFALVDDQAINPPAAPPPGTL